MQGLRRGWHLPAWTTKARVQRLRGQRYLRARPCQAPVAARTAVGAASASMDDESASAKIAVEAPSVSMDEGRLSAETAGAAASVSTATTSTNARPAEPGQRARPAQARSALPVTTTMAMVTTTARSAARASRPTPPRATRSCSAMAAMQRSISSVRARSRCRREIGSAAHAPWPHQPLQQPKRHGLQLESERRLRPPAPAAATAGERRR